MGDDATNPNATPIRPKHAVCVKCGYEFGGGVTLENGYLVCPECAHAFDVRGVRPRRSVWLVRACWILAGVVSVLVPVAVTAGFFATGGAFDWVRALIACGIVAAIVVLVWVMRWAKRTVLRG